MAIAKLTSSIRLIARILLQNTTSQLLSFSAISTLSQHHPNSSTKIKTFSHIFQQCSFYNALNPGKQAHAQMIVSGFIPTIFVTNCLIKMYINRSELNFAYQLFDRMPIRDVISYNTMMFGFSSRGEMGSAEEIFCGMPSKDVVSWNSMISGFVQNGEFRKSVDVFFDMGRSGVSYDHTSLAVVLKACACLEDEVIGMQLHGLVIRMGFDEDVVTASALLDMYAKCSKLDDSLSVFGEIPEKNAVCWSAMIAGCVQNNHYVESVELFKEMQKAGFQVSQSMYASVFRSCAGMSVFKLGVQLHGHALKRDFGSDIIVGTAILDMYAKCGSMRDAKKVYNSLPRRSLQCYNAITVGYARNGQGFEAFQLFRSLLRSGIGFNEISLSGAFSACAAMNGGDLAGPQVHSLAVKSTLDSNICVANAILDMYGKCGALTEAVQIFDEMEIRDAVSWNAIIAAYEQNENETETLSHFAEMLRSRMEPDEFTYGSVLKACSSQQTLNYGMEIHNRIIKSGLGLDWFVGGALIDMYSKCGRIEEAKKIHDRTKQKTIVSWNALISGFSLLQQSEEAHRFFSQMLEMGVQPDNFTYAIVLDACAHLATVGLGKQIHAQIIKQELNSDAYIASTLVDMYSKCGNVQDCRLVFDKALNRDFVTWNVMICAYSQHGLGEEALKAFENMQRSNIKPNHATFVSILRACAHMGLVDKGLHYFDAMLTEYGLEPQLAHYSCMVDILGRAGRIDEALKLIQDMPFEADSVIWKTLLGICKANGNVEVAEEATKWVLRLDPQDSSAYVLLSNIYANARMWDKVAEMRKEMRCNGLKKEPGCSWIEVKDEVHAFMVREKGHPDCEEIYEMNSLLVDEMMSVGYMPHPVSVIDEESHEEDLGCAYGW